MGTTDAQRAYEAELQAKLAKWRPELAGWRNFQRLDVTEPQAQAQPMISERIALYEAMIKRAEAALAEIEAINKIGYPTIVDLEVPAGILALLERENREIDAALATVHAPNPAVAGVLTIGPGVPDPTIASRP